YIVTVTLLGVITRFWLTCDLVFVFDHREPNIDGTFFSNLGGDHIGRDDVEVQAVNGNVHAEQDSLAIARSLECFSDGLGLTLDCQVASQLDTAQAAVFRLAADSIFVTPIKW